MASETTFDSRRRLLAACGILAATSLIINFPENVKEDPNAKEKRLLSSIQFAKRRAVFKGTLTADDEITFEHLRDYLRKDGKPVTFSQIAVGKHNGTGKNITTWGTIASERGPTMPPTFSYTADPVSR